MFFKFKKWLKFDKIYFLTVWSAAIKKQKHKVQYENKSACRINGLFSARYEDMSYKLRNFPNEDKI
jgi:hypothetical protein